MRTTKPPPLQQLTHDTHVQNGSNNLVRRYVTSCLAISSSLSRRPYAHPAMANDTTHSAPSDITHYQYPARPVGEMIPVPVAGHHSSSSRSSELEFSEHCTWVVDHGGGFVGSTIPHKRQQELCGAAPVSRRGQETSHNRPFRRRTDRDHRRQAPAASPNSAPPPESNRTRGCSAADHGRRPQAPSTPDSCAPSAFSA